MTLALSFTPQGLVWAVAGLPESPMDRIILAELTIAALPSHLETPLTRSDLVAFVGRYARVVTMSGEPIDTAAVAKTLAAGASLN